MKIEETPVATYAPTNPTWRLHDNAGRSTKRIVIVDHSAVCYKVAYGMYGANTRPWIHDEPGAEFADRLRFEYLCIQYMWPDRHCVITLDSKPYWRADFYPKYKSSRKAQAWPSETWTKTMMMATADKVRTWALSGMGWDSVACQYAEADDMAWALACDADDVVIYTSDKDWMQLGNLRDKNIAWYRLRPMAADEWIPKIEKVDADKMLAAKIVAGDRGDDVDGLPKTAKTSWGEKGAMSKIEEEGMVWFRSMREAHPELFDRNVRLVVLSKADKAIQEAVREKIALSLVNLGGDKAKLWEPIHKESFMERMRDRFGTALIARTTK